jgi:hypothetical protein
MHHLAYQGARAWRGDKDHESACGEVIWRQEQAQYVAEATALLVDALADREGGDREAKSA